MPGRFRPAHQPTRQAQRKDVDQRRGSARERGYDSRWDRAALGFKAEHPLCLGCEAVGRVEVATVVDHVKPHRGDRVIFWDSDRWQSCCGWHHDVVKKKLEALWDAGAIAEAELRLDSETAKRLTRELGGG